MMCVELRIRCSQPPSPALFGFLPRRSECSAGSPELRHQLATVFSHVTSESAFQRKNAAFLPVYLYWPISGVTLAGALSLVFCLNLIHAQPRRRSRSAISLGLVMRFFVQVTDGGEVQRRSQNFETKICVGGCHHSSIDENEPGFGSTKGNRRLLF